MDARRDQGDLESHRQIQIGALLGRRLAGSMLVLVLIGATATAATPTPLLHVRGMTFVANRGGNESMIIRAVRARFDTDAEIAYLVDVEAEVVSEENRSTFRMRCNESEIRLSNNDFVARGNVRGSTDSGHHFETDWVQYDHANGVLFTDAPVRITEEGTTYRGGGFRYIIEERRFRLLGGASVEQSGATEPAS